MMSGAPACDLTVGASFHRGILWGQWYHCHGAAGEVGLTVQLGRETESGEGGAGDQSLTGAQLGARAAAT